MKEIENYGLLKNQNMGKRCGKTKGEMNIGVARERNMRKKEGEEVENIGGEEIITGHLKMLAIAGNTINPRRNSRGELQNSWNQKWGLKNF